METVKSFFNFRRFEIGEIIQNDELNSNRTDQQISDSHIIRNSFHEYISLATKERGKNESIEI